MTDVERTDPPFTEPDADVTHDGTARTGEGVQPGDTGQLGAVDTETTPTHGPVPGGSGDPAGTDPAKETPGG
ncbi:MAG TPA: hypothetical protein VHN99_06410 [Deinococcales bacterium]|nr:hypothetical protein [Deinococcales bacterium]